MVRCKFEAVENSLRESIDYMVRHQWKETRNIVNKAMSKVVRPLQLKDLFYVNIGGSEHEVFKEKLSELSKELAKSK